jgi:hypothetical protein
MPAACARLGAVLLESICLTLHLVAFPRWIVYRFFPTPIAPLGTYLPAYLPVYSIVRSVGVSTQTNISPLFDDTPII